MALIAITVYATEENNKDKYLESVFYCLKWTVNTYEHRIGLSINNETEKTSELIAEYSPYFSIIHRNKGNIGTAAAINEIWKHRRKEEHCVKMDDDIAIKQAGWVDLMTESINRDSRIGQVGLKRKDCWETPSRNDFYKSELVMLPHVPGERWIVVEKVNHVMGSCVMHSSDLLNKVGYLYQPKLYGFDDSLMSYRSQKAGFINVFLPHIEIDHLDPGDTPYQKWKEDHAHECWSAYHNEIAKYDRNPETIYYNPYEGSISN